MHLSRMTIETLRNSSKLDATLAGNVVVVRENKVGKSNLMHALSLQFDRSLPGSARDLGLPEFRDGLGGQAQMTRWLSASRSGASIPTSMSCLAESLHPFSPDSGRCRFQTSKIKARGCRMDGAPQPGRDGVGSARVLPPHGARPVPACAGLDARIRARRDDIRRLAASVTDRAACLWRTHCIRDSYALHVAFRRRIFRGSGRGL